MTDQTFPCRMCGGQRPHNGRECLGCGAPIERAWDSSQTNTERIMCPKCNSGAHERRADDSYTCRACGAWFESLEVGYLDDRPDVNAEKRERPARVNRRGPSARRMF